MATAQKQRKQKKSRDNTASLENGRKAAERLVEMFDSGDMPAAIAKTVIAKASGDVPSDNWSLSNQLLMWLSGTGDARGFRQWSDVGRKVRKGKYFHILAPMNRKFTVEDEKTGEMVEKFIPVGFRGVPVWPVEETDGEELPPPPSYDPVELPPLFEVAERLGVPSVEYQPFFGRAYGSYYLGSRKIVLRTHDMRVFFHELAHAAHAKIEDLRGGQNPRQEIVAETVAATLCLMYGGEGYIRDSSGYIESYARGNNAAKAVTKVLSTVQKVLELILEHATE